MGGVSTFWMGNYPCQPVVAYLFVKSVNLSFMLEFKSDVIKDVSSAKMSHSFAAVKVLMKRIDQQTLHVYSITNSRRNMEHP